MPAPPKGEVVPLRGGAFAVRALVARARERVRLARASQGPGRAKEVR